MNPTTATIPPWKSTASTAIVRLLTTRKTKKPTYCSHSTKEWPASSKHHLYTLTITDVVSLHNTILTVDNGLVPDFDSSPALPPWSPFVFVFFRRLWRPI